jgi:predicted DNA-binding protein with PD1-like motif
LRGRAERSSPKAAQRRAEGAGLDGESAYRATIRVSAMHGVIAIVGTIEYKLFTHWHVVGSRAVVSHSYGCVTLHAVGQLPAPECLMHEA